MSFATVTAQVLFIDLATFAELEGFMYGGPNAITWFVASVQKSNWFSFVPISLRNIGTCAQFGACKASFSLSRQGDYVLSTYLRVRMPAIGFKSNIQLPPPATQYAPTVRYVTNLMHNLIRHVQVEFNDLQVHEFDSYWFDDNFEWRCPANKRQGYNNMIGNVASYTSLVGLGNFVGGGFLSCPLPLFFGEDSGIALPVAALPFNDVKITYDFRNFTELVMVDPGTPLTGNPFNVSSLTTYINGVAQNDLPPQLHCVETYAHYAVVHNDERVKMGDAPRDILIHQIQQTQNAPFKDITSRSAFDIRMSHAIVCFAYKARNVALQTQFSGTYGHEQSNYTTLSELVLPSTPGADPIAFTHLLYENSVRLANHSDYFALTHAWYFSDAISETTGYHFYSYALKPWDAVRPSGSTNYSKLANVSISHDASQAAIFAAQGLLEDGVSIIWFPAGAGSVELGVKWFQNWHHVFNAKNHNILRIANGSAGFPSL